MYETILNRTVSPEKCNWLRNEICHNHLSNKPTMTCLYNKPNNEVQLIGNIAIA